MLNRTVTQEIPTMDSSKSTDTVSSQMLGNTMEGLYRLDKDNKPIQQQQNLARKVKMVKIYVQTTQRCKMVKWRSSNCERFRMQQQRLLDPKQLLSMHLSHSRLKCRSSK